MSERDRAAPSGILLLAKQPGLTSFDCIRSLKKILNRRDLGHGGTLDKFASGLLPVLVGEGLKLARFFLEHYPGLDTYWKSYRGTLLLGAATETGDPEGAITETRALEGAVTLERIEAAMRAFVGVEYRQLPPRYSAKKIGGERASDLARAGVEPELEPVSVVIRRFTCTGVSDEGRVHFEVECSKGTYVRALAVDLARKLGTVAHLTALERTAVGGFTLDRARTLAEIESLPARGAILDMRAATAFLPSFELTGEEPASLRLGQTAAVAARLSRSEATPNVYCARADGEPVALLELGADRRVTFLRALLPTP